ncbi:helix-turn-helix domain-containing protein [Rhodococcus sp. NPDC060176]|uniref:helix-turn-helix domain-containing protein n=1 Tax=Rhodococcus sp. NPDC060176 TaxID=3347062 RepID=UPI00364976FD
MPNIDEAGKNWQKQNAARIGKGIAAARIEAGMSAVQLADRCKRLGFPISRVAISKIENGSREGKLDLAEILTLARALSIPPIAVIYPGLVDEVVEPAPGGVRVRSGEAAQWFWGQSGLWDVVSDEETLKDQKWAVREQEGIHKMALVREYERLQHGLARLQSELISPEDSTEVGRERIERAQRLALAEFEKVRRTLRDRGAVVDMGYDPLAVDPLARIEAGDG